MCLPENSMFKYFMKKLVLIGLTLISACCLYAQQRIMPNKDLMLLIRLGVDKSYNSEFDAAEKIFKEVEKRAPGHPASPLLIGLNYYYKYYPLNPSSPGAEPFEKTVKEAIKRSGNMLDKNNEDVEAQAMDMISRALLNMYYVDNGNSFKAIPQIMPIYRSVIKGFTLKEKFNEFYFTTGLYNYYREAYPDAHPVYKPIASLLQHGNKSLGIKQLQYAADSCAFLRNEALNFLKIIYLNYENNPEKALIYARRLYEKYPGNLTFLADYAETLLMNKQYEKAKSPILLLLTRSNKDLPVIMKALILKGIYEEKERKDMSTAEKNYLAGMKAAEELGPSVDAYRAYACLGLARVYKLTGNSDKSSDYRKKGEGYARYKYFFCLDQP
jgi:hypothetical protein